jgi:hypothetical protein
MKKILVLVGLSIVVFSCNKTGVTTNPPVTSFLKTVKSYAPQTQIADSFVYDSTHAMAQLLRYTYDSTGGTPIVDSMEITFSFAPNAVLPNSYTYNDIPQGLNNELHQLAYDNQNRIIKDTAIGGRGYVNYFVYSNNHITATTLFSGIITDNQIDSLILSNGNITEERVYYPDYAGTADSLSGDTFFGYSSSANPAYYSPIASSVGPLLHLIEFDGSGTNEDAISVKMLNSITAIGNGAPLGTVHFNLAYDPQGRLIKFTGVGYPGELVYTYY